MNKLFIMAGLLSLASCATSPKAIVTGEFSNFSDQTIYITEITQGAGGAIKSDSAQLIDGKFTMNITNAYPRQALLSLPASGYITALFIQEGTLTIDADSLDIKSIKMSGTLLADKSSEYEKVAAVIYNNLNASNNAVNAIRSESKILNEEQNARMADATEKHNANLKELNEHKSKALEANKDNLFGAYLTAQTSIRAYDEGTRALEKLSIEQIPANMFIDKFIARMTELEGTKPGVVAPDFTLQTPEGEDISLSSLRGKVVLIDFWASWCGPCRAANPDVVELYNNHKDNGFTVLGVSYDNNKEAWVKAIEEDGLTWHHGSVLKGGSCPTSALYSINSIPHTVLIDKDGVIVANNLHSEELDAKIAELTK